jgi:membrane protease YdiL (CAAX protease family)
MGLLKKIMHPPEGWSGLATLLVARCGFLLLAQVLAAFLLFLQHDLQPFQSAAKYWTIWASLADLATLALLSRLIRREGKRIWDLLNFKKEGLARDLRLGLILFPVLLCLDVGGLILGSLVVYRHWLPVGISAGFMGRVLPQWAVLFSRLVWWPLWSVTEELTFVGYALPRLESLTGKSWLAVMLVTLAWSVQHLFLPFLADGRFLLWRFLVFIPVNLATTLLYLRIRRLVPIIISHWGRDLLTTLVTII